MDKDTLIHFFKNNIRTNDYIILVRKNKFEILCGSSSK